MQLAPMRYTKIDGTAVSVSVTSLAQAKAALKELRHKKRELKFLRSALVRRQRAAARTRPPAGGKRRRSWWRSAFAGLGSLIAWLFEIATVTRVERRARDPAEIERELQRVGDTLHNIDGCILQLEGKMLTLG